MISINGKRCQTNDLIVIHKSIKYWRRNIRMSRLKQLYV